MSNYVRRGDSALMIAQEALKNYNRYTMCVDDICVLVAKAFVCYLCECLRSHNLQIPRIYKIELLLENLRSNSMTIPNIQEITANAKLYDTWASYEDDCSYHLIPLDTVTVAIEYCTQLKYYVHSM